MKIGYKTTRKAETKPLLKMPKNQPQINKIETIYEKLEMSWLFDNEVNEHLEEGWKLDRIEMAKKDNEIYLVGFLQKY